MGTTDKTVCVDNKKITAVVGSQKESKRRIKFTVLTKEELDRRRIPVYEYVI